MVAERPTKLLQNWDMWEMFSFSFKRGGDRSIYRLMNEQIQFMKN